MSYIIDFTDSALKDIQDLKKSGEKSVLKKIDSLINELEEHPYTGTGKPKPLKGNLDGHWSRRINQKHRLVYQVDDMKIIVLIISASGHYNDK